MTNSISTMRDALKQLVEEGLSLTVEQSRSALDQVFRGETSDAEVAALLTAIAIRGETVEELVGFVQAMRKHCLPVPFTEQERSQLVDTCGTGGDNRGTFNISTGAALVAAAAGAKVAKHGNRAVTSRCGSADVLEAMGVPVDLGPGEAAECLRATGFTFLFAPLLHASMKHVQPVRRALGFRSIFNLAGPLTNPAAAGKQIMGVYSVDRIDRVARTMAELGVKHAFVVHGQDGLDEITLAGQSHVAEVRDGEIRRFTLLSSDAGLAAAPLEALSGGGAVHNAELIEEILRGERGPRRDVVLLNAAAALVVADLATDLAEGARLAAKAVDSGAGLHLLENLRNFQSRRSLSP